LSEKKNEEKQMLTLGGTAMYASRSTTRDAWWRIAAVVAVILIFSSGAGGQKKQKDKPVDTSPMPTIPGPVAGQIDTNIGEMLGAFQVGNVEAMHKYYAENATFVRGAFEPPMVGWQNYAAQYEKQRAAFQGIQLIRRNTYIFNVGDVAWASYQWEFLSGYNGKAFTARGQTTLVFNKVGDNWLIVHNHTSEICDPKQAPQQQPAQNPPAPSPPK
jgi:ketosteroid isomerase-like protein